MLKDSLTRRGLVVVIHRRCDEPTESVHAQRLHRYQQKTQPRLQPRLGSSRDARPPRLMPFWHVGLSVVNRDDRSSHDPRT